MRPKPKQDQSAFTILLVLIVTIALSLALASLLRWSLAETRINDRHLMRVQSLYAAEAVVEHGFSQLHERFMERTSFPMNALAPGNDPLQLPDAVFFEDSKVVVDSLEIHGGVVPPAEWTFIDPLDPDHTFDPLAGRMVLAREVSVIGKAEVERQGASATAHVIQRLQVRDAPLFSNAIFYNLDLEIAPGPTMDVFGSVHGNRHIYVQSGSGLNFHDRFTSAGQLFHGRKPHSGQGGASGDVSADAGGNRGLRSFRLGSTWLQSDTSNWRSLAVDRWHGNVQTVEHGVQPHNPVAMSDYVPAEPGVPGSQSHNPAIALIHPPAQEGGQNVNQEIEDQKFSVRAGIRIRWNPDESMDPNPPEDAGPPVNPPGLQAFKRDGTPISLPPDLVTTSPDLVMRDARRGRTLQMADIDVGKLKQLIEAPNYSDPAGHIGNFDPATDWNGIVYFESQNLSDTGVRLFNGSEIPNRGHDPGFTFATNNALYVQGHYNADGNPNTGSSRNPDGPGEPPAALIGDAITILSENWRDDRSHLSLSDRPRPSFTEISAAILTGIVPTGGGRYSGGVENLPRLLENWSNVSLRIRGSMVVLYESEVATEPWSYGGNIYQAPRRDWGFHILFSQGVYPPGTPNTRTFRRLRFRDLSAEEYQLELAKIQSYEY